MGDTAIEGPLQLAMKECNQNHSREILVPHVREQSIYKGPIHLEELINSFMSGCVDTQHPLGEIFARRPHNVLEETKEFRNNGPRPKKVIGSQPMEINEFKGWRTVLVLAHNRPPCKGR